MTVSLKTQVQSSTQYALHAKCRYCGNAWFPFGERTFNPPLDAILKCSKCKSKQHFHWVSREASIQPLAGKAVFPNLNTVDFQKKVVIPKNENPEPGELIVPQIKQSTPEIAPLPELKEKSGMKQESKPLFKARLIPLAGSKNDFKPAFKASSRFQGKVTRPETSVKPRSEIKPIAPAPTREIKISEGPDQATAREVEIQERPAPEAVSEVKIVNESAAPSVEVKIIQPSRPVEPKPIETRTEVSKQPVEVEPEQEPEERHVFRAKPEPETAPTPEVVTKVEVRIKEQKSEEPRPAQRSMFKKPQSSSQSEIGTSPGPLFKSKLRRNLKTENLSVDIPKIPVEQEAQIHEVPTPEEESEQKKEIRRERHPHKARTKKEPFLQKQSEVETREVEVREAPLEDEPELDKLPVPGSTEEAHLARASAPPSHMRKKPIRKLEQTEEIEGSEGPE